MISRAELEHLVGPRYVLGDGTAHGSAANRLFGYDTGTGTEVFIKARNFKQNPEPEVRQRTRNEADALASISHPQVPRLIEAYPDAMYPYIVMQRMPGSVDPIRALERHASHHRAAELVIQALDALQAVHEAGFSHGDVKENNLVVPESGRAALIDFEWASPLSYHAATGVDGHVALDPRQAGGTGPFMAPEQFYGPDYDGVRSDIYAMGITAGVLVYGERPYHDLSGPDRYVNLIGSKVLHPELVPWPAAPRGAPSELLRIIDKATQADPLARYATAADMALDLAESLPEPV